jgi:hypothetical protein
MAANPEQNPRLVAMSMIGMILILIGLLIDVWVILGWRRQTSQDWNVNPERKVAWDLGDVFKVFVLFVFTEFTLSVFFGFIFMILGRPFEQTNLELMSSTLIRSVLIYLYIRHLTHRKYQTRFRDLGLTWAKWSRQILTGIITYAGLIPIYALTLFVLMLIIQWLHYETPVQTPVQILYQEQNMSLLYLFMFVIGILGPFFEEVFFRGFVYQAVRKKIGARRGIVLTSVFFALLHFHLVGFIPIFILGVVLNVLFEKTGSVVPGTVLHITHNTLMLSITLQVKDLLAG